jgi:hypothetical protein
MLRVWRERDAILMKQDHDAITIQYPENREDEIIPKILAQLKEEIPLANGRSMVIPYDAQVGWNLGKFDEHKNPNGVRDHKGHDNRKRIAEAGLLDRIVRRASKRSY